VTTAECIRVLNGHICQCGAAKTRKTAFCGGCYCKLSDELRAGLWSRIGSGFEGAYDRAVEYLKGR
jgi:hypothetical protein